MPNTCRTYAKGTPQIFQPYQFFIDRMRKTSEIIDGMIRTAPARNLLIEIDILSGMIDTFEHGTI